MNSKFWIEWNRNMARIVLRAKWNVLITQANAQGHYAKSRMLRRAANHMELYA